MAAAVSTAGTIIQDVEALDEDYFIVMSTTSGVDSVTSSYRVVKVIDKNLGQSSTATNSANGISYTTAGMYFDQKRMHRLETNLLVVFGHTASAFTIHSLFV